MVYMGDSWNLDSGKTFDLIPQDPEVNSNVTREVTAPANGLHHTNPSRKNSTLSLNLFRSNNID